MARFKNKRQIGQKNRWLKVKLAQQQKNQNKNAVLQEESNSKPELTRNPLLEERHEINTEPEPTRGLPSVEQQVIKTGSTEIVDVSLPLEEPTEARPIPDNAFCCLCLRIYRQEQFVKFSPHQSRNSLDIGEVQSRLANVLGLQIDLVERGFLCRSCWALTELLADFRASCWKAAEWRERFSAGIKTRETSREGWLKRAGVDVVTKTRTTILDHTERIEQARIERQTEQIIEPDEDFFQDDVESLTEELESTEVYKAEVVEQSVEMVDEITEIKVYSCPKCEQKFEGKHNMIIHLYYCKKSATNKQRKRHTCTICSADFNAPKKLQDHLNKHKGVKPYKCRRGGNCNHHSYSVKDRIRHEGNCGKEKPICPECGLQSATQDSLKVHMETHGEATHPCDICGKLFKSKSTCKKHRLIHSDRDFPCSVCKKSLKSTESLRVHMRIHTQEKPFSCAVCGMGFAYKCLVKPHIQRCHSGEDGD